VLSGANLNTLVKLCGFRLPHPLRQAWDSRRERIFNSLDEDKSHLRANIVRKLAQIFFILFRQNHAANAGAARGQDLLLHAADRQYKPSQRDLTGLCHCPTTQLIVVPESRVA